MEGRQGMRKYAGPRIADYGGLEEITAVISPIFGTSTHDVHDLSFSTSAGGTTTTTTGGGDTANPTSALLPSSATNTPTGTTPSGTQGPEAGGVSPASATNPLGGGSGGASGGGAGGGKSLPFTGFEVGPVAALGTMLTSAGVALRRAVRRRA